mmetsp:Transcript_76036/g.204012  ORF Transcript_76036/g.204012 Transcript_76036/m.204012 type:complete len:515 (+) Transcript_76036:88-1632(+)
MEGNPVAVSKETPQRASLKLEMDKIHPQATISAHDDLDDHDEHSSEASNEDGLSGSYTSRSDDDDELHEGDEGDEYDEEAAEQEKPKPTPLSSSRRKSISTPSIPNWPQKNIAQFNRGKELLSTLNIDPLSFSSDDLVHLTLEIFNELNMLSRLRISEEKMQRFILAVRDRMLDNPYHNWTHIFDVTQTVYTLGTMTGVFKRFSDMELFALLISALCHDLEHPGVNNVYLIKSRSSLIALYSDDSILEKHHSYRAFELMLSSDIELLRGFSENDYEKFRELVMGTILATDMGRHKEYTDKLKQLTSEEATEEEKQLENVWLMQLLLKCADTSNVFKPFEVAKKWAICVTNEFFLQGDMERANGFEITPMCDRRTQSRVKLQQGFIDFVTLPFYTSIAKLFPELQVLVDQIRTNREGWNAYDDAKLEAEHGKIKSSDGAEVHSADAMRTLKVVTWNMAAVNNNPFEYWITHQSDEYVTLMNEVQRVVDQPGAHDIPIHQILTDRQFSELLQVYIK